MQPETLNRSIQPTPTVHPRGFTPTCVQYWKAANRSHGNRVPRSRASMARVMSFGVRPAFLQILGNAGELVVAAALDGVTLAEHLLDRLPLRALSSQRSGDSVALVLKASASSRNRAGRPVLNGFRAYTVAERRAVHFAPGAPPTLPGGVAPGVSVLAGGRSSRRESRSIMLRPSLQISPFLRVCPVNPAGNATYDLRTHHVIHAARSV